METMRASKVLIADDEPSIVEYLELEMANLGCSTVRAQDGREAVEKAVVEPPDLILMDVRMPILDGLAACRMLKSDDGTRLIPVVLLTALDGVEERIRGIEAGADDYLTKPVDRRELLTRVETSLKLKQAVDAKLADLRRINNQLGKFVPETIRRLATVGADQPLLIKRERDVSVLFVDISDYTGLSARLPLEEVNALVERYFSTFLDRVHEAGGDVTDMAGDGFMALFQDGEECAHAMRATDAALALLAAAAGLNRDNSSQPVAIHMGIESGVALVGPTRLDGRRGERWTFTANGPVTNLAARLAAAALPGQLLVGPETTRRLGDRYRVEPLGPRRLKNIPGSIEIHHVLEGKNG